MRVALLILEGFAPTRHLLREDGKSVGSDEAAQFMVIEFDRNEKRIVVSHTRIWEQAKNEEFQAAKKEQRAESEKTKTAVKNIQGKVEKATLGDLGALASIKEKLQQAEGGKEENKKEETKSEAAVDTKDEEK